METRHRSITLRILAPLALIVFGIALAMIISTANKPQDNSGPSQSAAQKARDLGTGTNKSSRKTRTTRNKLPQRIYIVKTGDTLGSISEKVGVPVAKIQELNPNLDQFALSAGQKIKIR
jgi:LysM repeat protein